MSDDKPKPMYPRIILSREDLKDLGPDELTLMRIPGRLVKPVIRLLKYLPEQSPRGDVARSMMRLLTELQEGSPDALARAGSELDTAVKNYLWQRKNSTPEAASRRLEPEVGSAPLVFRIDEADA